MEAVARDPGDRQLDAADARAHGSGPHGSAPRRRSAYRKLVGRLRTGDPRARVGEDEAQAFFAPYAPWSGLAGAHALRVVR